ncbi:MAG TPA: HupE/UreJ family protein [Candidatus Polarisedimenticolaceae bacterium]|nr:HupE/UreJ family protein [Candidatus Polarisedimenticolaceae bacterium]
MPRRALPLGATLVLLATASAAAHEMRPAYLEIRQTSPGRGALVWRTPAPVALELPAGLRTLDDAVVAEPGGLRVERRDLDLGASGFDGRRIAFPGLEAAGIDVIVRIVRTDGTATTAVVHPGRPWIEIAAARSRLATLGDFVVQGIRHILTGPDHLLFVFGLVFLVRTPWRLAKTITGFTLAHSLTLAIATIGGVRVPAPPLEAAIALSILFLGPEIVRARRGETSFTIRNPWVVAFAFGLLHGFGFASGLAVVGLPHADIPPALLGFNGGVEIGQLAFVAVVLIAGRAVRALGVAWPRFAEAIPAYAVGSLGAFWLIERVAAMVGS